MSYKDKIGKLFVGGIQTERIVPTLTMEDSDDITTQNLGKPIKNIVGPQ